MNITFSTCWYVFKAKFNVNTYLVWIDRFLSNIENCYVVVYTDLQGIKCFGKYFDKPNIKFIIKPVESFYNYQYKDLWIENHKKNINLNRITDWKVNMLWSEKIHFVNETIKNQYFPETKMYGWCDIGYFRTDENAITPKQIRSWPSKEKIEKLDPSRIYYAVVNQDENYLNQIIKMVNTKNRNGVPLHPIPPDQITISGGFFILHKNKIDWWRMIYDNKLRLYFKNNYLIKDDQIILADCIFTSGEMKHFILLFNKEKEDDWFLFQKSLLQDTFGKSIN
uniref:Uncharacterized protein n=1 Tax=viral metagenome TaxID=1070528 RepID=A0A6C0DSJ4_9ZZZZ